MFTWGRRKARRKAQRVTSPADTYPTAPTPRAAMAKLAALQAEQASILRLQQQGRRISPGYRNALERKIRAAQAAAEQAKRRK